MNINNYKKLYLMILKMTHDSEGFGLSLDPTLDCITDEEIEKCKWITAMVECINDVPARRASFILQKKNIEYDYDEILDQLY